MKNLKTPLGLFGLAYLIYGFVMCMSIFIEQMTPPYLFLISMGIGVFFLSINKLTKSLPNYRLWQLLIGILPLIVYFILIQTPNQKEQTNSTEHSFNLDEKHES